MLPQELIRRKRDGQTLSDAEIQRFVDGLVDGSWSDSQAAALAMAIVCRGMDARETVTLTRAMTQSGEVLRWGQDGLPGPVLDKHSTGGVGDKVSLMLAPLVAACGGVVPMISGRGLGHTGGTLDKLEALPGYRVDVTRPELLQCLRAAGCAIVGASAQLAPADRRLYAIRDVTATVESVPLITASILSKKLAAGLQGLVMDVKQGNGAFTPSAAAARTLAESLVRVARGAGLPTVALITDMSQPLGHTAGNALELREAIDFLTGARQDPRLLELTLALSAQLLVLGGLAADADAARVRLQRALDSGAAAERFARMVAGLGGPADALRAPGLAAAPLTGEACAAADGWVQAIDTRALGLAVVELGGGRERPGAAIDPRVGLSELLGAGRQVRVGEPLARVHAGTPSALQAAQRAVAAAYRIAPSPPAAALPVVQELVPG
ncbi:MAG: thymidine phosphorylase [Rubrivivax sp.]|nr:thymidine phosphorylase [Rubrivivax sp.]